MFNQDQNTVSGSAFTGATTVDAGLRTYMLRIYNLVAIGLALSGAIAFGIAMTPALYPIAFNPITMWVTFGVMIFMCFKISPTNLIQGTVASANGKYFFFCAIMGISLAAMFAAYTGQSITRVFFITAATFGAMSLWGYTTKRNMASFGSFLMMGLIGLVIASVVNMFLHSSAMQFIVSIIGVFVFTGLIAFQTQTAKRLYSGNFEQDQKMAVFSAFGLYINFVNLFQSLLSLMGNRS